MTKAHLTHGLSDGHIALVVSLNRPHMTRRLRLLIRCLYFYNLSRSPLVLLAYRRWLLIRGIGSAPFNHSYFWMWKPVGFLILMQWIHWMILRFQATRGTCLKYCATTSGLVGLYFICTACFIGTLRFWEFIVLELTSFVFETNSGSIWTKVLITSAIFFTISASPSQAPHIMEISLISATRKAVLSGIQKMDVLMSCNEADYQEPFRFRCSNFRIPCNIYCAQVLFSAWLIQFSLYSGIIEKMLQSA